MAIDTRIKPTAKVTASTAALAAVELTIALVEWIAVVDVPTTVEIPLALVVTFAAGWLAPREGTGRHVGS